MDTLTRNKIKNILIEMNEKFNEHNLDGVLEMLHPEIYFENWTGGKVKGIEALRTAWTPWFRDHGNFHFTHEDFIVDEIQQKAITRWRLDWPSTENGLKGFHETRRGVDVVRFDGDKIIEKLSYSKTTLEIGGRRVRLQAQQ